jgi:hypothetical protein
MGVLGGVDLPYGEPDPERKFDAIFSLVIDRSDARTRQLPTLYFGGSRIYVDRDVERVTDQLARVFRTVLRAEEVPTYQVAACRVGDRQGLYLADFCNRTAFRQKLARLGMEFSDSPFVRLLDDGAFDCDEWGQFSPTFLALSGNPDAPQEVVRPSRGYHVMSFAALRLGDVKPPEFVKLANALRRMDAVGANDPGVLMRELVHA